MTEKEFTVEDLANEVDELVQTEQYVQAFSRLMDHANLVSSGPRVGAVNRVQFVWALGSKMFMVLVDDGEIVSMRTAPRYTTYL